MNGIGGREVHINLHTPKDPARGRLIEKTKLVEKKSPHHTWHLVYDISGARFAGRYLAGQSLGVIPPGVDEEGRPHKLRLYSVASPWFGEDGEGKTVAFCVKREIDEHWYRPGLHIGVCSNYLCNMQVGEEALLTGPSGNRFLLPEDPNAHRYVFIATGTGIAPFRGFLLELERAGYSGDAPWLFFGVPYSTDILYDSFFRERAEAGRLRYHLAISREGRTRAGKRPYVQEVMREAIGDVGPVLRDPRTLVYLCGLKGMETGIYEVLGEAAPDLLERHPKTGAPLPRKGRVFVEVY